MWNNHKIRTASNKTPLQLFVMGLHVRRGSLISNEYFEQMNEERAQDYGIDHNGPFQEDEHNTNVVVPDIICTLTDDQMEYFTQEVFSDDYAIDIWDDRAYLKGLNILTNFIQY